MKSALKNIIKMENTTTKQLEGRTDFIVGMTDCLYWRSWGPGRVHCHAEHPNKNNPTELSGEQCTKNCGRGYTPLTPEDYRVKGGSN